MKKLTKVAIVAGEASGDILGADLIAEIKKRFPECVFEGIGGERMLEQGFVSLFPIDRLSVMGLIEPLKRLPELLAIRRELRTRFTRNPPDVFIGIDAPDFNLSLEETIKTNGTPTVHYVSPSVWAWRRGRIKKIARAVDLMLTLFPFEEQIYRENSISVACVGHPLADEIPLDNDVNAARERLGLEPDHKYLAILPGSRASEIRYLLDVFLRGAELVLRDHPDLKLLIPAVNTRRLEEIRKILELHPALPVTVFSGRSHDVMAASDIVLIASGTSTLEAMLLKRPMVIGYKMSGFSFALLKRIVKVKFVGLPNLLAGDKIVTELLQDDLTPSNIARQLNIIINVDTLRDKLDKIYREIHLSLMRSAGVTATNAIIKLLEETGDKDKNG